MKNGLMLASAVLRTLTQSLRSSVRLAERAPSPINGDGSGQQAFVAFCCGLRDERREEALVTVSPCDLPLKWS